MNMSPRARQVPVFYGLLLALLCVANAPSGYAVSFASVFNIFGWADPWSNRPSAPGAGHHLSPMSLTVAPARQSAPAKSADNDKRKMKVQTEEVHVPVVPHRNTSYMTSEDPNPQPRLRFCVLDDPEKTHQLFMQKVREVESIFNVRGTGLHRFFAYGRDRGKGALPGLLKKKSPCPRFPLLLSADWACWMHRANGRFAMTKPFAEVQTIWLNQDAAGLPPKTNLSAETISVEADWLAKGVPELPKHCRRGCDCRMPYKQQPTMCHVNDFVRILSHNQAPYRKKKGTLTLIVAGHDDPHLSQVQEYAEEWVRSGWFKRIFFEAGDIRVKGIDSYVKVFDQHYMMGREKVFLKSVLHARLDPDYKNRMALGAWGRRGGITGLTNDALALNDFVDSVHAEFNQSVIAGTNTSALPFIDRRMVGIYEYFRELSKYKFLIAPHGGGIQSPKFLEALMVLTIPVTKRYGCFEQLQEYGMPIVLVDEWQDITEELLRQAWERYAPELERARWIGTVEGIESLYYGTCTD